MAARFNLRQCDKIRESIKVGMVVEKLQKCLEDEITLSNSQIRSAQLLLSISMPSLTASAVTYDDPESMPQLTIVRRNAA